nr:uncharacterized protein LOC122272645 [Parasteatoda tepidariorum]
MAIVVGTKDHHKEISPNAKTAKNIMCYSKILDAAYCQPCWLFASQRNNVWRTGIRDWKHLSERIKQHSCSSGHSEELENEIRKEESSWKMVLQRLFDIILTLAKSSLALRGHQEDLSQKGYHGKFLSFVELVARYDHILGKFWICPKVIIIISKFFFIVLFCL